jgi:hypothetical protein
MAWAVVVYDVVTVLRAVGRFNKPLADKIATIRNFYKNERKY